MYYQYEDGYGLKLAPAGEPDSTPPSAPAKLRAIEVDGGLIDLSWQPAKDVDTGVIQYRVYRDGEQIGTVKGTFFSDIYASGKTDARYQVSAVNYHGFEGPKSPPSKVKKSCAQE
jgi:chitinase